MMTRTLAALLALLCVFPEPAGAGNEEDPLAVLQAQVAAWNRGDLALFCEVYVDDTTFLSPSGITRGQKAVLDRYRQRYPDKASMGTLALEPIETRPAPAADKSPAVAVSIAARWTLSYPDKPAASGLTLLVLHRLGGRWQIVQDASF